MNRSFEKTLKPAPVDEFPFDESPFGVRGLAGNARDICLRDDAASTETFELLRGGGWYDGEDWCRSTSRGGDAPEQGPYDPSRSFRVCVKLTPDSRRIDR